ncbi:leucine-rich repeat, cysteine-containing subtype protein [Tanacetum coccineum]|uniref:Leucine-rich repeat, cysteine-containing subtype protein n=1 Tax=Tanacetum coccineum TaxID=301880 RepID=A0ABQ5IR53_9ASTR
MLMGCNKLERLDIWHGGLADVGLEIYREVWCQFEVFVSYSYRKFYCRTCEVIRRVPEIKKARTDNTVDPFSEQVVISCVFNISSLRKCELLERSCSTILADGDCIVIRIVIHTLSAEGARRNGSLQQVTNFMKKGKSNAGLVKLSEGCPRLRKLKLWGYPLSKQAVASSVFNLPSLRYV